MNAKIKKNSIKAVLYTALILICISWVFPLLFMLLTALRTNERYDLKDLAFSRNTLLLQRLEKFSPIQKAHPYCNGS